jgi:hypothetical protein
VDRRDRTGGSADGSGSARILGVSLRRGGSVAP